MIECHPLLRPVVQLAKPVVHAVRHWHPKRHLVGVQHHARVAGHHVHRALTAVTPPPGVMTVCQRVAGPIVAGGLVLLPPASAVPPVGGVGGFPGAAFPEYGAPAFVGPGFGGYGGSGPGYTGGYAGGFAPGAGFIGPGFSGGSPGATGGFVGPLALASNTPSTVPGGTTVPSGSTGTTPTTVSVSTPGTSVPVVVGRSTGDNSTPVSNTPGSSTPGDGDTTTPGGGGTTTPGGGGTTTPGGGGTTTPGGGGTTTPGGGGTTTPGGDTPPVDTPEPASIALVAGALAIVAFFRIRRRAQV